MRWISASWAWYRARRWWWRILIGAPVVLLALAALYVAARGIQYATESDSVTAYIPANANLVCGVRDLDGEWTRLQETPAWKIWRTRIVKDAAVRADVNATLRDLKMPTLDDLDDRRFIEKTGGLWTEEVLLRMAGRDVMGALVVRDSLAKAPFVVATKVRFSDYLLLPFARIAAPMFGAGREEIGGTTALKIRRGGRDQFVVIDGAIVVASNDKALLAAALRRNGRPPKTARPFWVRIEFESSAELASWRKFFRGFPQGASFAFLNSDSARAMTVEAGISGSAILLDVNLEGASVVGEAPEPEHLRYAPSTASGVQISAAGATEVYGWFKALLEPTAKASGFGTWLRKLSGEIVRELAKNGFETEFMARVRAPMAIVMGSEEGTEISENGEEERTTYTTLAVVFTSDQPEAAIAGLRGVFEKITQNDPKAGKFRTDNGVTWLDRPDPFHTQDYLTPCLSAAGNTVVLANNLEFARRVLRTLEGQEAGFTGQDLFRTAPKRMKEAGFEAIPASGDSAAALFYIPRLREGLEGHLEPIAKKVVDQEWVGPRVRAELDAAERRTGRVPSVGELDAMVLAERRRRDEAQVALMKDKLKFLDYLKWIALGARPHVGGVSIRLMIELR